jgi:hypothetical protein
MMWSFIYQIELSRSTKNTKSTKIGKTTEELMADKDRILRGINASKNSHIAGKALERSLKNKNYETLRL